jgi:hypothetical protein
MATGNLQIANFNTAGSLERNVGSSSGIKIQVTVGPQSFVQVTEAQVGPLPWTVGAAGTTKPLQVNSLPAIVAYGAFSASGALGGCYLTSVVYPKG